MSMPSGERWFGRHGRLSGMRRYPREGWIAGVCAGLAETFDWNAKLVRLVFVVAFVFGGFFPAGVVYLLLWYLMDEDKARSGGYAASAAPEPSEAPGDRSERYGSSGADPRARFARMEERLRNLEECVTSNEFELRRELRQLES